MAELEPNEILRREREERLPRVTALYTRGRSVREIAALEGVNPRVIYKDIDVFKKRWIKKIRQNAEAWLAQEIALLMETEKAAWDAFERSRKDQRQKSVTVIGKRTATTRSRRSMTGEMRCLEIVLKCHDRRVKLLGLLGQDDANEEFGELRARVVEIVVDTPEQVAKILTYQQYEDAATLAIEGPRSIGPEA